MSKYSRKLKKLADTAPEPETAILVALIHQQDTEKGVADHLDELAELTETLGAKAIHRFTQRLERPDVRTFVGSGKMETFLLMQLFLVPVLVFFIWWFAKVYKNKTAANFINSMRMNLLASICTNGAFIFYFITQHFE